MANEELVARLRAGVEVWNCWRRGYPSDGVARIPQIRSTDFSRANPLSAGLGRAGSGAGLREAMAFSQQLKLDTLTRYDDNRSEMVSRDVPDCGAGVGRF